MNLSSNIPAYIRRALAGWIAWRGKKSNERYLVRLRSAELKAAKAGE